MYLCVCTCRSSLLVAVSALLWPVGTVVVARLGLLEHTRRRDQRLVLHLTQHTSTETRHETGRRRANHTMVTSPCPACLRTSLATLTTGLCPVSPYVRPSCTISLATYVSSRPTQTWRSRAAQPAGGTPTRHTLMVIVRQGQTTRGGVRPPFTPTSPLNTSLSSGSRLRYTVGLMLPILSYSSSCLFFSANAPASEKNSTFLSKAGADDRGDGGRPERRVPARLAAAKPRKPWSSSRARTRPWRPAARRRAASGCRVPSSVRLSRPVRA